MQTTVIECLVDKGDLRAGKYYSVVTEVRDGVFITCGEDEYILKEGEYKGYTRGEVIDMWNDLTEEE